MSYNGWTNYETWTVPLHINNEQGSSEYWRERTREIWEATEEDYANITGISKTFTHKERAIYTLERALRDEVEENNPLADSACMYSQLLTGALSDVNWHEIAKSWLTDIEDEAND